MAKRKVLVSDDTFGPLASEQPLSVSPKRRFHVSDSVDLLGRREPHGPKLIHVVQAIATVAGMRVTSVQSHRFDVVPRNPSDLSAKTVDDFMKSLRASEGRLEAVLMGKS